MKKLLIGLCAASLIAASAIGYAGSVTFVNKYDQPVTFVLSEGSVYNPVIGTTLDPGERASFMVDGPITSNHHFMAYPPKQAGVVTNCGSPLYPLDNVIVKAGWSMYTDKFACQLFFKPMWSTTYHHACKHKHTGMTSQKQVVVTSQKPVTTSSSTMTTTTVVNK
jgi:hypothetical protein